jgi:hypothetical protein
VNCACSQENAKYDDNQKKIARFRFAVVEKKGTQPKTTIKDMTLFAQTTTKTSKVPIPNQTVSTACSLPCSLSLPPNAHHPKPNPSLNHPIPSPPCAINQIKSNQSINQFS